MISSKYKTLLVSIKDRISAARYNALKTVNKELINLYWDIGKMIVQKQKGNTWGKSIVNRLACDLQKEFKGIKGFSSANLWRMKLFYEIYRNNQKLAPMVREISWSKNVVIFEKCHGAHDQEFYLRMAKEMGWSKNTLIHQIENHAYEKTELNQTNFKRTLPHHLKNKAKLAVKDEYVFDFLDLDEEYSERQFEKAILKKVERFIQEMGGMFSFMGSQFRLEVSDIVEYALRESKKPIGVASYRIVSSLPKGLSKQLPAPEQVAKLLEN